MIVWLSILAAFLAAVSSGVATVLQKISADKAAQAHSLSTSLFFKLLRDWPYLVGIILDLSSWILTLVAVHNLALFIVQPILAFTVVATVLTESLIFHRKPNRQTVIAIVLIIFGLLLLGITAAQETVSSYSNVLKLIVVISPLFMAILGSIFAKTTSRVSTIKLSTKSGLAFGGATVAGRMMIIKTPYWHSLFDPLFLAMAAYGVLAILLLTMAIQRQFASVVMAIIISSETIVSVIIGLLFLGDSPRHGLWAVMAIGGAIAVIGCLIISVKKSSEKVYKN